jgi:hypothetical protein
MINIKVLADCAEVSYQLPNSNKKQTKIIGISDIPALFDTKISYDSDILPLFGEENAYGVQRIIQKDNQTIIFIQCLNPFVNIKHTENNELDALKRAALDISHIKTKQSDIVKREGGAYVYKNIYMPNLLMMLCLKKDGRGSVTVPYSGVLCYEDTFITDQTQLYRFPFSNTYDGSTYGKICWGDQSCAVKSVAQSIGLIHSFLGGVMNVHLFTPFKIKNQMMQCSSQVLAYLSLRSEELKAFPYSDFNLKKEIKYKELVNFVGQNWK